ncbi:MULTISPECIES: VPA1269 family protein [Pseudomonas]|uniref:Integrase n=1 Tax=Pseudomonas quercus TaxID=2722792 RepID=A0ABX0YDV3_9PSED|nr:MULTISPECIES: VPA1269 family protein [Pseudomonas]MBF7143287.1 hypothetical protein [Pseudomonas sp. LY10J]NJP01591.1 hypothetical protein [Pseudomonas quercus]
MVVKENKFYSLSEARAAVRALGITTVAEYLLRYKEDPRLPSSLPRQYEGEWKSWYDLLSRKKKNFYTYEEAKIAIKKLGIKSTKEYASRYKENPRLPCSPAHHYAEWSGYDSYMGIQKHYKTFKEAHTATLKHNFKNKKDYMENCKKKDTLLSVSPYNLYEEWISWDHYLGKVPKQTKYVYEELCKVVVENNADTVEKYNELYKNDIRVPVYSSLKKKYKGQYTGIKSLFHPPTKIYSYQEAVDAVRILDIRSRDEFFKFHKQDPSLPFNPALYYTREWKSWNHFLPKKKRYITFREAHEATQRLGIKTKAEYLQRFLEDDSLPRRPEIEYKKKWPAGGWADFLKISYYGNREVASQAARDLGISSLKEYYEQKSSDLRLPPNLFKAYPECSTFKDFIIPKKCSTLKELKLVVKVLGIKNSVEYRVACSEHSCLPSAPYRSFPDEWTDWYDFCDILKPHDYETAKKIAQSAKLAGMKEYKDFVKKYNDPRLPLTPDKVYNEEWVNWPNFLGKAERYTLSTIPSSHEAWRPEFADFLREKRGASVKENFLVRILRDFVIPMGLSNDPKIFYTLDKFHISDFEIYIESLRDTLQRKVYNCAQEFSTFFLSKYFSIVCEETGTEEIAPVAKNPFRGFSKKLAQVASNSETDKPALSYSHICRLRDWIIPENSESFSELAHLQRFGSDWYDCAESILDPDDKNCVFRVKDGKYQIWYPANWLHSYALASVPLRGRQIAYNDSGEGDLEIPVIENGVIVWVPNQSNLAGKTDKQGFLKKYPNNEIGMHITSNKTSIKRASYSVPWMPEKLALWVIRLREWQTKYNPIERPMPWTETHFTKLANSDLVKKGSNCFLFRDFGSEECPGSFSHKLGQRISIALYNSQPSNISLATLVGDVDKISSYYTIYTPHTMRVSLITAYVMEFRMPISAIMKMAGHSSLIMSLYYVKVNGELLRAKFSEGEKRALAEQATATFHMLEQERLNNIQSDFVINNEEAITRFMGKIAPGSALFRDFGICPFASNRCSDGYGENGNYERVPAGYLGSENCVRCRHLVSGPVFLGGLLSLANEISLAATKAFEQLSEIGDTLKDLKEKIREQDDLQFDQLSAGLTFDPATRNHLEVESIRVEGLSEASSRKADIYLSDMNAINRLIVKCISVLGQGSLNAEHQPLQLVFQAEHETVVSFDEVSLFQQYSEVCENAEIYVSANADLAITPRSQLLDRMLHRNKLKPLMFELSNKQQLSLGNQLVKLMLTRTQSWSKLNKLIDGDLLMQDLPVSERLTSDAIKVLLKGKKAEEVITTISAENPETAKTPKRRTERRVALIEYEDA